MTLAVSMMLIGSAAGGGVPSNVHSGVGAIALSVAMAGVGLGSSAGTGVGAIAVGLDVAGVGMGSSVNTGDGSILLGLGVAGVGTGSNIDTGAGSILLSLAMAGVGTQATTSVGTIGLSMGLSGVGARATTSVGTIGLSMGISGVGRGAATSVGSISLSMGVAAVGSGGAGSLLKTLTLVNTSGSATATNSHTPTIGLLFKKGDIPTGTYPTLKTSGGTNVPYTYWNKSTWSDGSMKILPVLPRFPNAITGSGTATMEVWTGGGSQSPSSRTLAELYAENMKVVGTTGLDNISGNWTCDLQAANIIETVSLGDGPAGRLWRFMANFTQAGSPHGQLVAYFYIMALQNASGNLAGWRVLPRVTQPYYNFDSPAKNYRSFTSLVLQAGGSTICDPMANSYSAKTFTWANSGVSNRLCTSTANGFNSGGAFRLTTTGTLPTGLSTGTTYWIYRDGANNFYFCDGSCVGNLFNGINAIAVTSAGSGTHTMTPIPYVSHFCSYWGATTEGKYVYFQGAGSVAAQATLRVTADKTYDHSTKVLPPYDMSIGTVASNTAYNWAPYSVGELSLFIGTSGERDDIGVLNSYHVRHFYTQAAVDERVTRIIGLAQGMLPTCIRDHATLGLINIGTSTYSGMPANLATTARYGPMGPYCSGFTAPSANGLGYTGAFWTQCFSGTDPTHMTQYAAYPYIMTGEPQYYDLLAEMANASILTTSPGDRNFTYNAITYNNIGPAGKDSVRTGAWTYRDIVWAAALSPDANSDGSALTTYLKDNAARQSTYMVAYNAGQSSWWTTNGFWFPQANVNGRASWQQGYVWSVVNLHAAALENANALTMTTSFSKWPPYIVTQTGSTFMLASYYEMQSSTVPRTANTYITTFTQWGAEANNAGGLSWVTAGNLLTWTTPNWTPANGDKVIFADDSAISTNKPGPTFTFATPYYAVSVSGNNFQLSDIPGGSAKTIGSNGNVGSTEQIMIVPVNSPSTGFVGGAISTAGYGANQSMNVNWALALGITTAGLAGAGTNLATRQASVNYTTDPKYCTQTTF